MIKKVKPVLLGLPSYGTLHIYIYLSQCGHKYLKENTCSTRPVIQYLYKNSQAVKKGCGLQKSQGEKRCEIKGGGQEMAVMVS